MSFQNYEHFKRLTLDSPDSDLEYLNEFDYHWGYTYKVKVKETRLKSNLSDGTRYEYEFIEVVSKTKMPNSTEFRLFLDPQRYYYDLDSSEQHMNLTLKKLNDSTYHYFDEVEIEVPIHLLERFEKLILNGNGKLGHFIYVSEKRIRLVRI
jgi:hypothetical protein